MNRLVILGANGHGKVVADIASKCGYKEIVFLDDNERIKYCMEYPVIGKCSDIGLYLEDDFVIAIGNPQTREKMQKQIINSCGKIVSLIHPSAVIASGVQIGKGTVVMAGAVINPDSKIGDGCIINTGATVDHDNVIEDFVHVSVGSHLAGTVRIGKSTWTGVGAVVSNNISICEKCVIGAGAVVVRDIVEEGTYVGVPAKKVD